MQELDGYKHGSSSRLKFARVVTLQGPRQCGKSTLTREWVTQWVKGSSYRTLDRLSDQEFARDNPESFLAQSEKAPLQIVDEAQKAPPLFDAIKAQVDENPRPGQFLLLGSTEFSRETQIRENLTGRISRQRLFTLTGAEAIQALTALATVDEPTVASVAGKLRKEGRRIKRLFGFLEQLFVLHRIDPHALSTGKSNYYLCDVALARFLGAAFERQIETWFLHEQLAQRAYALKLLFSEKYDPKGAEILHSLGKRFSDEGVALEKLFLGPSDFHLKKEGLRSFRWEGGV